MAHIRKIPSGKWQAEVRLPNGKRKTKTSALRSVVAAWARDLEREVDRGTWVDPAAPAPPDQITFGDWAEQFMATRTVRPETRRGNRNAMVNHVLPAFGELPLSSIKPSTVRRWLADMDEEGPGRAMQRKAFSLARLCIDAAVADEIVKANPFRAVKAPSTSTPPVYWFTQEQVTALTTYLPQPHATQVLVMAWCGLRWGECCGLKVEHVNVLRRRLNIIGQMSQRNGVWVEYAKTDSSRREVPVPAHVFGVLVGYTVGKGPDDLLFTTRRGTGMNGANWRRTYDAGLRAANEDLARVPDYPPHALRHTAASWLLQAGVPLAEVGKLLGHATAAITSRYAHLVPDYHEPIENGWERLLSGTADVRQMYGGTPDTEPAAETS